MNTWNVIGTQLHHFLQQALKWSGWTISELGPGNRFERDIWNCTNVQIVSEAWLLDLNKLVHHTRHRGTFQMHHHCLIKMHHQLHQVVFHQHLHRDLHMEHRHHNMAVIRHNLDQLTRPDHRIKDIPDSHRWTRIISLHSMVIRATRAEDIQDSLNIMANIILKVNITLNSTDTQGTPDMDIKIMVTTVTMVKRTKTKVQLNNSNFTTLRTLRGLQINICWITIFTLGGGLGGLLTQENITQAAKVAGGMYVAKKFGGKGGAALAGAAMLKGGAIPGLGKKGKGGFGGLFWVWN